jgi:hypothetical protein
MNEDPGSLAFFALVCSSTPAVPSDRSIRKKMNLENEIIAAVVVLYVLLSAAIVLVHYLQPEGQETMTSSPSHTELREGENEGQTPRAMSSSPAGCLKGIGQPTSWPSNSSHPLATVSSAAVPL